MRAKHEILEIATDLPEIPAVTPEMIEQAHAQARVWREEFLARTDSMDRPSPRDSLVRLK